jgi:zinc transport system permease protein
MVEWFLINSLVVGIMLALSLCPLGSVMLWRKIPYIGDSIAHASVLGIVIALFYNINVEISIIVTAIVFVGIIVYLRNEKINDILIIIFAYGFLAVGLFLINFISNSQQTDIFAYLFGDILLVTTSDIIYVSCISVLILGWLYYRWEAVLLSSINEDLAIIEGYNTKKIELELMIAVAFIVSFTLKIVGALLATALLITPAIAARNISINPIAMVVKSIVLGIVSVSLGLLLSYFVDSPSGPSIILVNILIFIASLFYKRFVMRSSSM